MGASRPSPSAARLSRSLLYGRGATGQKVKMNQWPVFIRGLEKQRTSPWASGRRAWNSPGDDGGKRQTVCTQNIYQGAREEDHMGSAASFSGCIYTKIQHCGKKVEFIYFQQGSQGVEAFFCCGPHRRHCIPTGAALNCTPLLLQNWPRYAHLVPQVRHINTLDVTFQTPPHFVSSCAVELRAIPANDASGHHRRQLDTCCSSQLICTPYSAHGSGVMETSW